MFRYKVMSEIVYKGRTLAAGRLIRASRDSAAYFREHYGDRVQIWEDWPNSATEPKELIQKNKKTVDPPSPSTWEAISGDML